MSRYTIDSAIAEARSGPEIYATEMSNILAESKEGVKMLRQIGELIGVDFDDPGSGVIIGAGVLIPLGIIFLAGIYYERNKGSEA
jgi:hypothetical protein